MLKKLFKLFLLVVIFDSNADTLSYKVNSKLTYIDDDIKIVYDQKKAKLNVFSNLHDTKATFTKSFLPNRTLEEVGIYKNKLVMQFVEMNNDFIYIIDLNNQEVIDKFKGFFCAISPNSRYIVFKKWHGRNAKSQYGFPAGVTMLYDLELTPAKNRTAKILSKLKKNHKFERNYTSAGHPVYPIDNVDSPSYGWIKDPSKHYKVNGFYSWNSNNEIMFALLPKHNTTTLVQVLLFNDKAPITKTFDLSELNQLHDKNGDVPVVSIVSIERINSMVRVNTSKGITLVKHIPN